MLNLYLKCAHFYDLGLRTNSLNIFYLEASKMDSEQFAKYLELLDHPKQLTLGPNVTSLYYLYREHMTTFTYNNLNLYLGKPKCDLSISGLLKDVPSQGGHCYQHSELMFAALSYLGFQVERDISHITSSLF